MCTNRMPPVERPTAGLEWFSPSGGRLPLSSTNVGGGDIRRTVRLPHRSTFD